MKPNIYFWLDHAYLFLEWDIFQKKLVEKIQTKFYVPSPFILIVPLMGQNVAEPDRPKMTM